MSIDVAKGEHMGCATVRRNLTCLNLLAALAAGATGCGGKPLPKADLTMTAEELAKGYADEAEGDKKYNHKTIRVQGVVERIEKDELGVTIVILKGDGKLVIGCGILIDSVATAKALKPGQSVTIQGKCWGRLRDRIVVNSCTIGGK
jgi:hypothetical protein